MSAVLRRVEHHMTTAITLVADGIDRATADRFFGRIAELETILSRFRPDSALSRFASGELSLDDAGPEVRDVLARCEALRALTAGDFEHRPRARTGDARDPVLDTDAVAKGWIVDDAAMVLRTTGRDFLVNAGGDVVTRRSAGAPPWRVAVQHPDDREGVLGVFALHDGAVATSGRYERGDHIRTRSAGLVSVTVVGPDLAEADGLSTAVFASGIAKPSWWDDVDAAYGLLTVSADGVLRWAPPRAGTGITWHFPDGVDVRTAS